MTAPPATEPEPTTVIPDHPSAPAGDRSRLSFPGILVVNYSLPPAYGGAEIAAYRYAERLYRDGHDVLLAGRAEEPVDPPAEFVVPVVVPPVSGRGKAKALREMWTVATSLWPVMIRHRRRYQVVHVFNAAPLFNLMAVPLARLLGKPVVVESSLVGSDDPVALRRKRKGRRDPLRYRLYRRGTAYVAKSWALVEAYSESRLPPHKNVRIPYAVDTSLYRPATADERTELRSALGLPAGTLALFVGGLSQRKGLHVLIESFAATVEAVPDAQLALVGPSYKYDSGYVDQLLERAGRLGIGDRVVVVDRMVNNTFDYMRAADVFVLPSSREGLPISVIEAMACGLGIVASDIPEIARSQIASGTHGLLAPFGDVDRLSRALMTMMGDPKARIRMGGEAYRRAVAEFSVPAVDRQYAALYRRLLSGKAAAADDDDDEDQVLENKPRGDNG